jgi:hypothetical protein
VKISTIRGDIEENELEKREYLENGSRIVEYFLGDELVMRSSVTGLTPLEPAGGEAATFG